MPNFTEVKRLELAYVGKLWLLIPQILGSCSELEHLCINTLKGVSWNEEPQSVPCCMVTNLKTLKLADMLGNECDIQLLKFMLANSKVLKMLTVMFHKRVPLKKEGPLSRELSMLPRTSWECQIHYVGKRPHATTSWYF